MFLTPIQTIIMIFAIAFGAMSTRILPFLLFPEKRKQPQVIHELSQLLPPAMMGLLVVYCLKGVSIRTFPYGLPEVISIIIIVVLHRWKHNVLLSIGAGTACYMILVQYIFI